ncbi:MAG: DUF3450 family protein [Myxococcota bacterium]
MRVFLVFLVVFTPLGVFGASGEDLARLRQAVDRLASELEDHRRTSRDELSALRTERFELARQLRLERVRAATLARIEAERTAATEALDATLEERRGPALQALDAARNYVNRAIPFQVAARKRELDRVETEILAGRVAGALERLWRFLEQEEAMGGEISLSQQSLTLDGRELFVDVARIGMALVYFRVPDGTFAWARFDNEWRVEKISDTRSHQIVATIFERLEANQRLGAIDLLLPSELPDAY